MPQHPKMANFGESVDISSRQTGATDALKDLGMASPSPQIAELSKTRLGGKVQKPPKLETVKGPDYTTSGVLVNPKVAFFKTAAEEDAPNYMKATSPITSCTACKYYKKQDKVMGHCHKYDFYANGNYTCDAWVSRKNKKPRNFS